MAVVEFIVRWPDGVRQRCASPSPVICDHIALGASMPVGEFVAQMAVAMQAANECVRRRYGFSCGSAAEQHAAIVATAARYATGAGEVRVVMLDGITAAEVAA